MKQPNKDYIMDIRSKLNNHDLIMVPSATVIPFKDNKVLLQKRSDTGTWGTFGGGIQYNEKIQDTAIRELLEESNLECKDIQPFGIYSLFPIEYANKDKVNAFTIAFICSLKDKNAFKANDGETIEAAWFNIEQIKELTFWNKACKEIIIDAFSFIESKEFICK
ncbi:NUDIX domain-containing protein [Mycoplasma marinum]|uniref:Nudix hydrolase domain-containing protein n=1 Tax=Mycoplasma marinum TaxID=1937190 RepID=A0A4R0XJ89_9MOLU|nr:NUDIX domain-containing protein [Mycoplasma marinum]TCG10484.1 hypothetical protein C4B24_04575 [Mycoplasma marinum]